MILNYHYIEKSRCAEKNGTDYYPHGSVLPGRNSNNNSYLFGYQGQEQDAQTGYTRFNLRQFNALLGRWSTPDPMGQYHSAYLAMGNNPVSRIDPTGGEDYENSFEFKLIMQERMASRSSHAFAYNNSVRTQEAYYQHLERGGDLSNFNHTSKQTFYSYNGKLYVSESNTMAAKQTAFDNWVRENKVINDGGVYFIREGESERSNFDNVRGNTYLNILTEEVNAFWNNAKEATSYHLPRLGNDTFWEDLGYNIYSSRYGHDINLTGTGVPGGMEGGRPRHINTRDVNIDQLNTGVFSSAKQFKAIQSGIDVLILQGHRIVNAFDSFIQIDNLKTAAEGIKSWFNTPKLAPSNATPGYNPGDSAKKYNANYYSPYGSIITK